MELYGDRMRLKQYINENEIKDNAVSIIRRDFKKMGLVFQPKWDDFIKNNMKIIDKETEGIKKEISIISNEKLRKKKYQDEMKTFKVKLTNLWSAMKKE